MGILPGSSALPIINHGHNENDAKATLLTPNKSNSTLRGLYICAKSFQSPRPLADYAHPQKDFPMIVCLSPAPEANIFHEMMVMSSRLKGLITVIGKKVTLKN